MDGGVNWSRSGRREVGEAGREPGIRELRIIKELILTERSGSGHRFNAP